MPNIIDANGLTTKTQSELIAQFTEAMQAIYGPDINLSQDTPDGQMMMIFIQAVLDNSDLLKQINSQFDPDQAIGNILDQRVSINGIQRQAGTFTVTPITITTDRALNLYGLDQAIEDVFIVKDNAGNEFALLESFVFSGAASESLSFRSVVPGEVLTIPNTITLPVTIVLGVTAINNPTSYTVLGINEESDSQLRIRRQQSVSLSSQGYLASLYAALYNINGVSGVYIHENNTGSVDGDGTPSHCIWVIVSGTGEPADIAQAIYVKRNAGCNMRGDNTFDVEQLDGSFFTVRWDDVEPVDLFIEFDVSALDEVNAPDPDAIKAYLVENFKPAVYGQVNINDLATMVQQADDNALVTGAGFSLTLMGSYTPTLRPDSKKEQFVVSADNINITVL
jgi:uncharacterized phage protein gp47/JayE